MIVDILEFGLGFLILISVWIGYTNTISVLPVENNTFVSLNLLLIFLVSIEPYLFYLNITFDLASHELFLNLASVIYGLDMTGLMIILGLFTHEVAREERGLVPKDSITGYKRVRNTLFVPATLFAITIMPIFWFIRLNGQPIRFYFWFIPLFLSFGLRISVLAYSREPQMLLHRRLQPGPRELSEWSARAGLLPCRLYLDSYLAKLRIRFHQRLKLLSGLVGYIFLYVISLMVLRDQ